MYIIDYFLFKFNCLLCLTFVIFDTFLELAPIPQLNEGISDIESDY
jgi:hypothetical protein